MQSVEPSPKLPSTPFVMAPARVLIVGAGVAGPPLAALLKMKGYDPVVFERIDGPPTSGLALGQVVLIH